jgi:formate dehydrogenase subunit delta
MPPEKLLHMANQIGKFFASQPHSDAPAAIADHLRKFWDPRMRREIVAYLERGGDGFDSVVREAVQLLAAQDGARKTA